MGFAVKHEANRCSENFENSAWKFGPFPTEVTKASPSGGGQCPIKSLYPTFKPIITGAPNLKLT